MGLLEAVGKLLDVVGDEPWQLSGPDAEVLADHSGWLTEGEPHVEDLSHIGDEQLGVS